MSNLNISTRRTTLNKLSVESPLHNPSFRSPKSPNFTPPSNSQNESQDGEFVMPKPTKKIKPSKNGENTKSSASEDQLKTGWSIPNLSDSAQLDELLKSQAPGFLENIQMTVPDENWQREALKQIENSSLQKILQNNMNGFNTEGTFSGPMGASYESLKPDEIMQLLGKFNDDFKQKIDYFPSIQGQFSQGLPAIPDIPPELQNALDDFVYQQGSLTMNGSIEKFLGNQSQKLASADSNKSHILPKATNELIQSGPNKTKSKSQIETEEISHQADQNLMAINQLKPEQDSPTSSEGVKPRRSARKSANESQSNLAKSNAENPASDATKNFPPKELLGKRSLPKNNEEEPLETQSQGDKENQRRTTRRSKTSEFQDQQPIESSPKNANKKSKIPSALVGSPKEANKNQMEEEKKSPRSVTKDRKSPRSTKDKASSSSEGEDDTLEMPFSTFRKEKEAMEIEQQQNSGIQRIVNLKIGKNHQIAPTAFVLNKERPRREVKKLVWNPKCIEEKVFDDYFEQLRNIIEKGITNEEVACRTLIKFDTDVHKAIDNIKRNVAYYKNQMIPGQRVLRNRASFLS